MNSIRPPNAQNSTSAAATGHSVRRGGGANQSGRPSRWPLAARCRHRHQSAARQRWARCTRHRTRCRTRRRHHDHCDDDNDEGPGVVAQIVSPGSSCCSIHRRSCPATRPAGTTAGSHRRRLPPHYRQPRVNLRNQRCQSHLPDCCRTQAAGKTLRRCVAERTLLPPPPKRPPPPPPHDEPGRLIRPIRWNCRHRQIKRRTRIAARLLAIAAAQCVTPARRRARSGAAPPTPRGSPAQGTPPRPPAPGKRVTPLR